MRLFGLIGYPLAHSYSKQFFTEKFNREGLDADHRYLNFELRSPDALTQLLNAYPELCGLQVTSPHKVAILPFLDALDPVARETGSVNTLSIFRSGNEPVRVKGYNTDVTGFDQSLNEWLPADSARHVLQALILGTGGAARAVHYVLQKRNIASQMVGRNGGPDILAYTALSREVMESHRLIVHATPVGTFPHTGEAPPIPYEWMGPEHLLYDLVYNPEVTLFLKRGAEKGARITNGLRMLHLQADASWNIWQHEPGY